MIGINYNDPISFNQRKGTSDDPYISIVQPIKIINNMASLSEVPDSVSHVIIDGYTEIYKDSYSQSTILNTTEFYVDYVVGVLYFNDYANGKTLNASYMGKGLNQYPADRILVHSPNPYASKNLQELIDLLDGKVASFNSTAQSAIDNMTNQTNSFINVANSNLTSFTNSITSKETDYVQNLTNKYNEYIIEVNNKLQTDISYITSVKQSTIDDINDLKNSIESNLQNEYSSSINAITSAKADSMNYVEGKMNVWDGKLDIKYAEYIELVDAELLRNIAYINQKKQEFIEFLNGFIDRANAKIVEMSNAIQLCQQVTIGAEQAITDAIIATASAIKATNDSIAQLQQAITDDNNSKLIWQSPPANSYLDILDKFPNPLNGWATITLDTGNIYRFNGNSWYVIGNVVGNVPIATAILNGLMSMDNFNKLAGIESGATKQHTGDTLKNDLPDSMRTRTILFIFPYQMGIGVQDVVLQFPNDGIITNIKAFCQNPLSGKAEFTIEKISNDEFIAGGQWINLLNTSYQIKINALEKVQDGTYVSLHNDVVANDYFRVNVTSIETILSNLTIQIDIKI